MAPTFESMEPDFVRLRDFILNDLDRIVGLEHGGNFAAVALVLIACEALGKVQYGGQQRPDVKVFAECLPAEWRPVAPSLYDALRNGLVHRYEATTIRIDSRELAFVTAWRSRRHLTLNTARTHLCIAVPDLVAGLHRAFERYEAQLRIDPTARDKFFSSMNEARTTVVDVRRSAESEAWMKLIEEIEVTD